MTGAADVLLGCDTSEFADVPGEHCLPADNCGPKYHGIRCPCKK
jgi:hypothetical protein